MNDTTLALAVKVHQLAPLTVFDRINGLLDDGKNTAKGAVGLGAILFILWLLFRREGMGRLIMGAVVAAVAVWLTVGGGIDRLAGDAGTTWEGALPASVVLEHSEEHEHELGLLNVT